MKHHEVHHDESSYDSFHNYETGELKTNQIAPPTAFVCANGNFQSHGQSAGGKKMHFHVHVVTKTKQKILSEHAEAESSLELNFIASSS